MRVDEMPAGREMNALIAEKAMGWTVFYGEYKGYELFDDEVAQGYPPKEEADGVPFEIPYYSTDIAAAWEVVNRMKNYFFVCGRTDEGRWEAIFYPVNSGVGKLSEAHGDTAPSAICRAALKAMGVTEV